MNRIFQTLNHLLWYLFFSIYWTAYELGEKDKPQENAKHFIVLTIALNLCAIYEMLMLYGIDLNAYLVVFISWFISFIITNRLFFKHNRYIDQYSKYEYLKGNVYKYKRYRYLIFIALWSMAFVAFGAILRMK